MSLPAITRSPRTAHNGTDLANYTTSIACTTNRVASESGDGASLAEVTVDSNDVVVCTITNTRKTGKLTVVSSSLRTPTPACSI